MWKDPNVFNVMHNVNHRMDQKPAVTPATETVLNVLILKMACTV